MLIYFAVLVVFLIVFATSIVQKKQIDTSDDVTINIEETGLEEEIEAALLKDAINKRENNFVQIHENDDTNSKYDAPNGNIQSDNNIDDEDMPNTNNKFVLHRQGKRLEVKTFHFDT
jgi:hypothetical protein